MGLSLSIKPQIMSRLHDFSEVPVTFVFVKEWEVEFTAFDLLEISRLKWH